MAGNQVNRALRQVPREGARVLQHIRLLATRQHLRQRLNVVPRQPERVNLAQPLIGEQRTHTAQHVQRAVESVHPLAFPRVGATSTLPLALLANLRRPNLLFRAALLLPGRRWRRRLVLLVASRLLYRRMAVIGIGRLRWKVISGHISLCDTFVSSKSTRRSNNWHKYTHGIPTNLTLIAPGATTAMVKAIREPAFYYVVMRVESGGYDVLMLQRLGGGEIPSRSPSLNPVTVRKKQPDCKADKRQVRLFLSCSAEI